MVTDSISDMLIRIKNGYLASKSEVALPWSKLAEKIASLLVQEKYLSSYNVEGKQGKTLNIKLKYDGKQPAISGIKRISRPSLRIYAGKNSLPKVLGGLGIAIVSTPSGLMTNSEAFKKGLGGEVMCEIW